MPLTLAIAWILATPAAEATEVVWLHPPADPVVAAAIGAEAGATRGPLAPIDLRAAATDANAADDEAIRALTQALRDVHKYDSRLDGELLIMNELEPAISRVTLLRDAADRDALFAALAYEGFAVDRFFADDLATDDRAAPFRIALEDRLVIRPWLDAVALDPSHAITPYDVAEAPQRLDLGKLRDATAQLLPALLVPDLPAGVALRVDGVDATVGPTGTVEVHPGRHLVAAVRDGKVLERWTVRLAPAGRADLSLSLPDAVFNAWIAGFASGTPTAPPASLAPALAALGGTVWVVNPDPGRPPAIYAVTPDAVVARGEAAVREPSTPPADPPRASGLVLGASLGAGWAGTWDFYEQDPVNVPDTAASVNALSLGASVDAAWRAGLFLLGAGLDTLYTTGAYHVAWYGENETRLRPYPHVEVGLPWVQATAGYVFPHNPGVGAQGEIPLGSGPFAIRLASVYGAPGSRTRPDGSEWNGRPLVLAWGGVQVGGRPIGGGGR